MYTSFWKLMPEETRRLRDYMYSPLYALDKEDRYAPSDFWKSLSDRTFVSTNGDVVMLHSGHAFVKKAESFYASSGNSLMRIVGNILAQNGHVLNWVKAVNGRMANALAFVEHLRETQRFQKALRRLRKACQAIGRSCTIPEILVEAFQYNETKVFDSIETLLLLEQVLEKKNDCPVFLEIGAGAGLTAVLLKDRFPGGRVVVCDLPATICIGYTLISYIGRDRGYKVLLPQEMDAETLAKGHYDYAFITPNQVDIIPDNSMDGVLNVHSMQEMTMGTIRPYFELIRRVLKKGGFFFCKNLRVSRQYPETMFDNYPWDRIGRVVVDGIAEYATGVYSDEKHPILVRVVRT